MVLFYLHDYNYSSQIYKFLKKLSMAKSVIFWFLVGRFKNTACLKPNGELQPGGHRRHPE